MREKFTPAKKSHVISSLKKINRYVDKGDLADMSSFDFKSLFFQGHSPDVLKKLICHKIRKVLIWINYGLEDTTQK